MYIYFFSALLTLIPLSGWANKSDPAFELMEKLKIHPEDTFVYQSGDQTFDHDILDEDIQILIDSMLFGYSGRTNQPIDKFLLMIRELYELKKKSHLTYNELQQEIHRIIEIIPDNHLEVMIMPTKNEYDFHASRILREIENTSDFWYGYKVDLQNRHGLEVLEVALRDFELNTEQYNSLIKELEDFHYSERHFDVLLLNLIDNPGGSISEIFPLWDIIQGGYQGRDLDFTFEFEKNPVGCAIVENSAGFERMFSGGALSNYDECDAILEPDYNPEVALSLRRNLNSSANTSPQVIGNIPNENGLLGDADSGKKMIIAINHKSASSAELMTEGFHFNDKVTRIGEHSAGAFHYGCPGIIWLKNISIVVYTPTCRDYFLDNNSIETKGEPVDISSTETTALDKLLEDLKYELKPLQHDWRMLLNE